MNRVSRVSREYSLRTYWSIAICHLILNKRKELVNEVQISIIYAVEHISFKLGADEEDLRLTYYQLAVDHPLQEQANKYHT